MVGNCAMLCNSLSGNNHTEEGGNDSAQLASETNTVNSTMFLIKFTKMSPVKKINFQTGHGLE